ncbi:MAG: hypothetical protein EOP61_33700 [Sphingomonadales bacterium]|nr:MAG: hypothetical protein EOP61_33700 [Sphingomonadales bacterium]
MRLHIALPLLLLATCHTPAETSAPANPVNETVAEQSMANSQFVVEDQIANDAAADSANF